MGDFWHLGGEHGFFASFKFAYGGLNVNLYSVVVCIEKL